MQKKSNVFKRALSILLSFTLVCGVLVFTANAATDEEFFADTTKGFNEFVGNDTYKYMMLVANEGNVDLDDEIKVPYKLFVRNDVDYLETFVADFRVDGLTIDRFEPASTNPDVTIHYEEDPNGGIYLSYLYFEDGNSNNGLFYEGLGNDNGYYIGFYAVYKDNGLKARVNNGEEVSVTPKVSNDISGIGSAMYMKDGSYAEVLYSDGAYGFKNFDGEDDITVVVTKNYTVTYDFGEGKIDDGGGTMVAPDAREDKVEEGNTYKVDVASYNGLKYVNSEDKTMVLKHWEVTEKDSTADPVIIARDADDAAATITPAADTTVKAIYAESNDGDDIPDEDQVWVTFKVREGDTDGVTGITWPDYDDEHLVIVTANEEGKIKVEKKKAIGELPVVTADGDNYWFFDHAAKPESGYFDGEGNAIDATYEVPEADATIEIRLVYDKDGNGEDDRIPKVAKVTYEGVEKTTDPNKVPQDAKYTVVVGDTEIATGNANAGVIALTEAQIPYKNADHYPVKDWTVEAVDTTDPADGVYDEVKITVTYGTEVDKTDVTTGEPVIDGTTDPEGTDPTTELKLEKRTNVIFVDEDDAYIKHIEIGDEDPVDVPASEFPSEYEVGVTTNKAGNKFTGWKITGDKANNRAFDADTTKTDEAYHKNYYLMVPQFEESAKVTIEKEGKDGAPNTTLAEELDVAVGKEIKVVNQNGDVIPVQLVDGEGNDIAGNKVPGDGTVVVPNTIDEGIPQKNSDGDYFVGKWDVNKDDDGNVVLSPKYDKLTEDDIVITHIPTDNENKTTGNGYTVIRGKRFNENVANVYFTVSIGGKAVENPEDEALLLIASAKNSNGFADGLNLGGFRNSDNTFKYDQTKSTDEYSAFYVQYTMTQSGIVSVSMKHKSVANSDKAHDVILVSDNDKNGFVNPTDMLYLSRIIKEIDTVPNKANEDGDNNYKFELMDMDGNGTLNPTDMLYLSRLVKKLDTIS